MVDRPKIIVIYDDREFVSDEVSSLVGRRRYGEIIYKRRSLKDHLACMLPAWGQQALVHLRFSEDMGRLKSLLENSPHDCAALVIAGRGGFASSERLTRLVERLPYAQEDFTDRLYKPLLVFLRDAHDLVEQWPAFERAPIHTWERAWKEEQRVESVQPLDLSRIRDFLLFSTGSTATRHFNEVEFDGYYYTKRSSDKRKMLAEYSFYSLVPEAMRPWLIQPFGYEDEGDRASYRMLRYYLADAALQWVHGALDAEAFTAFVDRLLFFLSERPRKACDASESAHLARQLFVTKVGDRIRQLLSTEAGSRINNLVREANPELDVEEQFKRYTSIFDRNERRFRTAHLAIGHGDPCFSNVLYDQQRYLLKLIDPKGAVNAEEAWTHPFYDLCKMSHSVLGGYDFINNGLYSVSLTDGNDFKLRLQDHWTGPLKEIFRSKVRASGADSKAMRIGEASLFLSMLPLHIDYPNKVVAFLLTAKEILDEVDGE